MAKKKATKKKAASNLNDIYNAVAAKADTDGVHINVAETKRVISCFFDVLEDQKTADAFDFISKGLKRAAGRSR